MMNMDYCKWENTCRALEECMEKATVTSENEATWARRLFIDVLDLAEELEIINGYDMHEIDSAVAGWKEADDE